MGPAPAVGRELDLHVGRVERVDEGAAGPLRGEARPRQGPDPLLGDLVRRHVVRRGGPGAPADEGRGGPREHQVGADPLGFVQPTTHLQRSS